MIRILRRRYPLAKVKLLPVRVQGTEAPPEIVGAIRYRPDGGIIDVGRLMVHPDYRRQGLAQQMLAEVDRACPDTVRELYTCTKSWINIRLYTKMGYRPVREVTEESGLSFVYMRKP